MKDKMVPQSNLVLCQEYWALEVWNAFPDCGQTAGAICSSYRSFVPTAIFLGRKWIYHLFPHAKRHFQFRSKHSFLFTSTQFLIFFFLNHSIIHTIKSTTLSNLLLVSNCLMRIGWLLFVILHILQKFIIIPVLTTNIHWSN